MSDHHLLFGGAEILELLPDEAAAPFRRAAATAGRLAAQMGASVWGSGAGGLGPDRAFTVGKRRATPEMLDDPLGWAAASERRILLAAADTGVGGDTGIGGDRVNAVRITGEGWHTEATLFAASGLADLFGDPVGAPVIPSGEWAAGTIAYAALGALASAQALSARGDGDVIDVDGIEALRWVNWKAPAMAWAGSPVTRQGAAAEWPVLRCADGFVAFVFTARDWKRLVEMVDDDRLRDERFRRSKDRSALRSEYVAVLAEWAATRTKAQLDDLFHRHAIPGASVARPEDLLSDPTLVFREVFSVESVDGVDVPVPSAPVRVRSEVSDAVMPQPPVAADALPLAGTRVLDLGVLTAGAGTSSLLADLGAEVIKIESAERPDMFRFWAGADDSPLFHFSNRSKLGVDLNLKDPAGRAAFLDLVAGADAVIENFRRGVLERLELGFDDLRTVNQRIVLGSVSGQGLEGPRADHTTFGSTLEAASGFAALTLDADGVPMVSGPNLNFPDQTVCLFAGAVLAAAITKSRASGTAMHLDISQRDVAVYAAGPVVEQAARGSAPSAWTVQRGSGEGWVTIGADGVTEQPVLDGAAVLDACLADGGGAIVEAPHGAVVKGFPFTFRDRRQRIAGPAPAIGQHNDFVLGKGTP